MTKNGPNFAEYFHPIAKCSRSALIRAYHLFSVTQSSIMSPIILANMSLAHGRANTKTMARCGLLQRQLSSPKIEPRIICQFRLTSAPNSKRNKTICSSERIASSNLTKIRKHQPKSSRVARKFRGLTLAPTLQLKQSTSHRAAVLSLQDRVSREPQVHQAVASQDHLALVSRRVCGRLQRGRLNQNRSQVISVRPTHFHPRHKLP